MEAQVNISEKTSYEFEKKFWELIEQGYSINFTTIEITKEKDILYKAIFKYIKNKPVFNFS